MRWCWAAASSAPRSRCNWRKRGLAVALVDRAGVGEQTSYGNAGIIEGNTVFPPAFPSDFADLPAHRAQAGDRGQLSPVVSAANRALAAGLSRGGTARAPRRARATGAAVICHRRRRARGAARRGRRLALPAQERLAQSLSQRAQLRGHAARARHGGAIRPAAANARYRRGAGLGALAQPGFRACGVLAAGGEREQSAWA